MRLKLNNIIAQGKIEPENKQGFKKLVKLYGNTLTITKSSVNLYATTNIHLLFVEKKLKKLIEKTLREQLQKEVKIKELKITNLHYSGTLPFTCRNLVSEFVPLLQRHFPIKRIEITQEPHVPTQTSLRALQQEENITFISLRLLLCAVNIGNKTKTTCLKLQLSKPKDETHVTVITNNWKRETRDLLKFLKKL